MMDKVFESCSKIMKKRILRLIAIASIFSILLFGCSKGDDVKQNPKGEKQKTIQNEEKNVTVSDSSDAEKQKNTADSQTQQGKKEEDKESQEQDQSLQYNSQYKQAARAYKKYYDKILSKYYQFLSDQANTEGLSEDMRGVFQSYTSDGEENIRIDQSVRSTMGYNLMDINADKIPELMIGSIEKEQGGYHYGFRIHALYTIRNGKAKWVFSSSPRDRYFYLGNDRFYNHYLETDGNSVVTVFYVDDKTGEYRYIDYYFTEWKEANSQEISYFYNKFGEADVPLSEKEYHEIVDKIEAQIKDIRFVPFSDYTEKSVFEFDSIRIQVEYSTKEEIEYAFDYDGFNTEDKEATMVTFTTNDMTKDFKILHLKNVEINENGKMSYEAEEAYHQEVLDPSRPFIAGLYFYGSIPNNGISYVNEDGDTVMLILGQSGKDGSLYLQGE